MDKTIYENGGWPDALRSPAVQTLRRDVLIREPDKGSYHSCIHNGDGTALVRWMEETNTWPEIPPTVHSFNPDGAARMRAAIRAHYHPDVAEAV